MPLVTYTKDCGTVRFYPDASSSARASYTHGVGQVQRWYRGVGTLVAFNARLTPAHLRALLDILIADEFTVLYVERAEGKGLVPGGVLVKSGDFAGMFRVDLLGIKKKVG